VLTDPMPADAVQTALKRVSLAAEDLDGNRVASLVLELAGEWGVPTLWEQVCRALLARLSGRDAAESAVELALSEGVRVGLDVHRREPGRSLPTGGVLLAGAGPGWIEPLAAPAVHLGALPAAVAACLAEPGPGEWRRVET
jgi:hypothetical protein